MSSPRAPEAGDPELAQALRRAFERLPPKLRAVASLALVEQEPYADVADALGISLAAVKSREFRAVRLLRVAGTTVGVVGEHPDDVAAFERALIQTRAAAETPAAPEV